VSGGLRRRGRATATIYFFGRIADGYESALALHDVPKKVACDGEEIRLHGIDAQIRGAAHRVHESLSSQVFSKCVIAREVKKSIVSFW
jgi:hypothetical protein